MNDRQRELVARARAIATARPVIDATTAIIIELCNEIAGTPDAQLPKINGAHDPRVERLTKYFLGKL